MSDAPQSQARRWCAMILVDLSVAPGVRLEDVTAALHAWKQGVRYSVAAGAPGATTGAVHAVVIEAPASVVCETLTDHG